MSKKDKVKIQEMITNAKTFGPIPADEVQLNVDVIYNSIIDKVCSVVPIDSPNQIVSTLRLKYGSKEKATDNNKDIVNRTLMNTVGAMPLDEYGYPTNNVEFEATPIVKDNVATIIGSYKNIIPGSLDIDNGKYTDDGNTNIIDASGDSVGVIDYDTALIRLDSDSTDVVNIKYKFDIVNLMTSRNFAYFEKSFNQMFAEQYQLDVDSALVLNDFKGLSLKDNIDKILPQVLAQQIDGNILNKYLELIDTNTISTVSWSAKGISFDETTANSATKHYMDLGTMVSLERGKFAKRTGVLPNVIICDPVAFGTLSVNRHFKAVEDEDATSGLPKYAGKFNDADVIIVQHTTANDGEAEEGSLSGSIILTYKGPSDAQASGVVAPFIPVTLRTAQGAEGGGMIVTNNIYSMLGFAFTNPELISGIKVKNIKY